MTRSALEESTYQRRPAYKYIRTSDRLPTYAESQAVPLSQLMAKVKLFDPTGSWAWYIAAYDADTRQAWGVVDGFEREAGAIDMEELVGAVVMFLLRIRVDNAAFEDEGRAVEVARILREAAAKVESGEETWGAFDVNGNYVGAWGFEDDEATQ